MYEVVLSKKARKSLKKLDKRYQQAVVKSLRKLAHNPKHGEPLKDELKGLWKLRFSRYRIIYQIIEFKLIIQVLDIKHRKDAYK